MPGFSAPTSFIGDPDMHVKRVLKKYDGDHLYDDVMTWIDTGPNTPGSLKKHYISMLSVDSSGQQTIDYDEIDLRDEMTWGSAADEGDMLPDQFFLDLYKAINADEKRLANRKSYEF